MQGQGEVLEHTNQGCGVPPRVQVGRSVSYTVFKSVAVHRLPAVPHTVLRPFWTPLRTQ